mgnify:CR=1 FL=1
MKMNRMAALGLLIAAPLMAPAAHAEGLGAEVNYGRADGHWGTEIGAGYALDMAGFSLTPGVRFDYYDFQPQDTPEYQANSGYTGLPDARSDYRFSPKLRAACSRPGSVPMPSSWPTITWPLP